MEIVMEQDIWFLYEKVLTINIEEYITHIFFFFLVTVEF